MINFPKDPTATLDYTWDWSAWLTGSDTIASVSWTIPSGLTKTNSTNTATTATVWVSGGATGTAYVVECEITTTQGRITSRAIQLVVNPQ